MVRRSRILLAAMEMNAWAELIHANGKGRPNLWFGKNFGYVIGLLTIWQKAAFEEAGIISCTTNQNWPKSVSRKIFQHFWMTLE